MLKITDLRPSHSKPNPCNEGPELLAHRAQAFLSPGHSLKDSKNWRIGQNRTGKLTIPGHSSLIVAPLFCL